MKAAVERLGLFVRAPKATTLVQGSERQYENGMNGGDGAKAGMLWLALCHQTVYRAHVQALPWAFA